jgi:hypothetical protein
MRLIGKTEDLQGLKPEFTYHNTRQRSDLSDIKIMFNLA